MLRQQSMAPIESQMVSGRVVPVSWTQGLAKIMQAYGARKGEEFAGEEQKKLSELRANERAQALEEFQRTFQGSPERQVQNLAPLAGNDPNSPQMKTIPGTLANPMAAYAALMRSRDPMLMQMGTQGVMQIPQMEARKQEREEQRGFQREQLQAQLEARREAQQQAFENQKALRQIAAASGGAQPYFQPVQTAQGVMAFNARTGRMEPIQIGGQGVVGAQYDPRLQGALTEAKETAKTNVEVGAEKQKNVRKADVMIDQLNQADKLLKEKPTASGIGSMVDAAGRMIGVTNKGAQTAGQLEALSGWLVANVPRMEGPQSNFDVQNYQTMAGKIGDRTVPIAERQAALQEVKRLQEKYKELNQVPVNQPAQQNQPASGFRIIGVK